METVRLEIVRSLDDSSTKILNILQGQQLKQSEKRLGCRVCSKWKNVKYASSGF